MSDPLTLINFFDRFTTFYREGAYDQALQLVETHISRFPENSATLMAWQSAMLSQLGRVDHAFQVLQAAYEQGHWYHEEALRHDRDFAALQTYPGFAGLVERMAARRQASAPQMLPGRQVIEPTAPGPHPLCLVLHGNHSNLNLTVPYWQPVVEQGWTLAALRSSQPGWASDAFVWDDCSKSLAEIKEQHTQLLSRNTVNPQPVIAGGFSMGATIAVRMALDPDFHLRGVIAHETWVTGEMLADLEQAASSAPPTPTRVLLIAGQENAEYAEMARQVHDLLSARGCTCQVIHSSNTHHGYPPDFAQALAQAVDWVMAAA